MKNRNSVLAVIQFNVVQKRRPASLARGPALPVTTQGLYALGNEKPVEEGEHPCMVGAHELGC